eukprot:UN11058
MSCEQYFQAMKFTDEKYQEIIRKEKSGMMCWQLGNSRKYKIVDDWEHIKVQVMYECNLAKFKQNPELFKRMLVFGDGEIKHHSKSFWPRWNGHILTLVRP